MKKNMNNQYANELIGYLKKTEIWEADEKYTSYDQGVDMLVNVFCQVKGMNATAFFIGNGGSAAIASHMTADFMKNGGMNTCSLYDSSAVTCIGNDYGYEHIFSRQLASLMRPGDLLVAISSSGNSANIINAIGMAKQKEAAVITFTGFKPDNKARQMGSLNVYVPCEKYGIVESIHHLILQQVVDEMMERDEVGR